MYNLGLTAFIAILCGLIAVYFLSKVPNINPIFVFFLIPFFVIFLIFSILQGVGPSIDRTGRTLSDYMEVRTGGLITNVGYFTIFPTIFAVFFLFVIFASYQASAQQK